MPAKVTAVWRPGSGQQYWAIGSVDFIEQKSAEHFEAGRRMVWMDANNSTVSVIWNGGSGAESWRTGMSFDALKKESARQFKKGRRMVCLDTNDGDYAAVWRPGSGAEHWVTGDFDDVKTADKKYVDQGLRMVSLNVDDDLICALWRPGTGAQRWQITDGFPDDYNDDQLAKGRRLVSLDRSGDRWAAVWRPGTGAQYQWTSLKMPAFKKKNSEYFAQGLRLVSIDTSDYLTDWPNFESGGSSNVATDAHVVINLASSSPEVKGISSGVFEVKSPSGATHVGNLQTSALSPNQRQVAFDIAASKAELGDWSVSYIVEFSYWDTSGHGVSGISGIKTRSLGSAQAFWNFQLDYNGTKTSDKYSITDY